MKLSTFEPRYGLTLGLAAVACLLVATGCSRNPTTKPGSQDSASNAAPPTVPGAAKGTPVDPGVAGAAPEKPSKSSSVTKSSPPSDARLRPQKPFEIAGKGQDGWVPSRLTPQQLGDRIDAATKGLTGASAQSRLLIENSSMRGENSAKIQIQDRSLYQIEYQLPDSPTNTNRLVGKGGKRYSLEGYEWVAGGHKPKGSQVSQLVRAWPREFTYRMFEPFENGTPVWGPLISGLAKGIDGYKTTVEERTLPMNGRQIPFYRVLAEKPGTRIEMRFEGNRFVPLVVKTVGKDAKGRAYNAQWQAGWSFGKKIDPKDVQAPAEK